MDITKEQASICMDIIEYAIENFPVSKENAREVIEYLMQHEEGWYYIGEECYQGIIFNLSEAYRLECGICKTISFLNEQLEKFPIVYIRAYNRKSILFLALGTYYAYLLDIKKAMEAFQKWIFYALIPNKRYNGFEFYSFRACNKYALDDLRNNTMTVSNPATFNDPLDCLLLHYFDNLKNKTESLLDDYVYRLAKEAHSYVKIRCF